MVVWKYVWELASPEATFDMPLGAEILHVGWQHEQPNIWVLVDPYEPREKRSFIVVGTGHDIPGGGILAHVGSMFTDGQGTFVFHVFEEV